MIVHPLRKAIAGLGATMTYSHDHHLAHLRQQLSVLAHRSTTTTTPTSTLPPTRRAPKDALAPDEHNKAYLLHQPRFRRSFALTFAAGVAFLAAASTSNELWINALFVQATLQNHFQSLAFRLELWSLMGLLSSSCCALQLLLNLASMGCAGFNTWLGPVRPHMRALTVLVQIWQMEQPAEKAVAVPEKLMENKMCRI